ncbi:glycosyltransferase [Fortiea sp. LEGE XX443]|uniref:glycosyltransferase family 2 protein n=1 Tax=Fortiea sp. LEGE XX443 TaxID=1828611 RepID=UPI0018827894|nr:glycosyltransferase family 2 protein [Fortiea sp. LEGE XX443]MBE9007105.1 glycosyltransferase [Fortiea sp. LEGE XX443]
MKVSIITVCKNADKYIEKAIKSVACQTYENIEYIIIDGDSQDRTKDIVSQNSNYISKFVTEPDNGIYAAMNKGINLASGDFIYFLGADDYLIDENVIDDVASFIKKNHKYEFIYGNIEVRSSTNNSPYIHKPPKPNYILEELICGCLPHQASFAQSSLFQNTKVGLFSEKYKTASDYEWFVKLAEFTAKNKEQLGYYDRVIASYNSEGISCNINNLENVLTEMFEVQNNREIYQSEYWLKRRINKYQQILIKPNGHWGLNRTEIANNQSDTLEQKINQLQAQLYKYQSEIQAMESSKFWKLRTAWFKLKKIFGLTSNELVTPSNPQNEIRERIKRDRQLRAGDDLQRLEHFGFKIYSQSDEDGIIEEIFNRIGVKSKIFVEFGAETGEENNSRYLLENGWTGLWIESLPEYAQAIRYNQKNAINEGRLKFIEAIVTAENINNLIESAGISGEIDFLSVDIDSNDYHVYDAISVIQPRVVCLEHNHCYPPPEEWIMPYNPNYRWVAGSKFFGASIASLEKLARSKDMVLVGCGLYSANGFYVRKDLINETFSSPFLSERFFNALNYEKIVSFPQGKF